MDRATTSAASTPHRSALVKRRSKSKSHRQSYRSCSGGAASRIGLTPALTARRLNTSRKAPKSLNITERVNAEHLALLVKTKWKLCYATPLYQFRHTMLKSYARQLSAFIVAEKQRGLAVEVEGAQNHFRASFSVLQGLAEADDPETILIQIHSKPLFSSSEEPQRCVWSGWLSCINGNLDYLHSLPQGFTCLPLFGSSGTEVLTTLVKSWCQKTFDCSFGPLEINYTSLQWFMALLTNCHTESNIQHLKMIWSIPVEPPLQVAFTVSPQDAWELWSSVRTATRDLADPGGCIDFEEVERFTQGLKSHFYRHFRLDLSAGSLKEVSTALGGASINGRVKISNSRYMITTLALLTECALLKMPI
ncbi:centromere protein L [Gouania willdenowi]|uniref:Centromere protein L n=1 Tax=Gouania willdenowi TaxID=441366 RepID=A0A8C5I725_GOUWI|nr:centromere protein L [Gouania willdenowi]